MNFSIISPTERDLLKQIEKSNDSDVTLWKISNIIIPISTIIISLGCFSLFKQNATHTFLLYLNVLLNGSIPMIALNRIGGMGVYLFKFDRGKEKKYGMADTYLLRTKLFFYFLFLLLGTIILYVYQVLHNPFGEYVNIFFVLGTSILAVYLSLDVSKKVYLLQDKLIDKTFDQEIRDEIDEKGIGKNW